MNMMGSSIQLLLTEKHAGRAHIKNLTNYQKKNSHNSKKKKKKKKIQKQGNIIINDVIKK